MIPSLICVDIKCMRLRKFYLRLDSLKYILMIKMVLFVQGLIGTVKAIASEVCDNTNQVDSNKFSTSWTYFKPRHAIFHTHFQTCTQFANPLSCPSKVNILFKQFFYSIVFELNVLIHLELKSQISLCALMVSLKTILSWIQNLYPFSDQNCSKSMSGTYL